MTSESIILMYIELKIQALPGFPPKRPRFDDESNQTNPSAPKPPCQFRHVFGPPVSGDQL